MTGFKTTTGLPASLCPSCGTNLNAATHPTEDVTPSPGDLTVCLTCQEILQFDSQLQLVQPTSDEMKTIYREHPELRALVFRYQRAAAQAVDKAR